METYVTQIAPTMGSRAQIDRPLAVVDAVNTASPVTWYVHVDHLNRPIKMTDAAKAAVWTAVWAPWGSPHSITGSATLDARFPGQWYQMEAGLHYNWHRSYDPSLGRYTQPDPLGFVDGPSVFGYSKGAPYEHIDPKGLMEPKDYLNPVVPFVCGMAYIGQKLYCKSANRCTENDTCSELATKIATKSLCIAYQQLLTACYGNFGDHGTRIADERSGIKRCNEIAATKGCLTCPVNP